MSITAFLPVAATVHVAPGKYTAKCVAVQSPELYRGFTRWYMRIDFAIRDEGSIVSKYVNFGTGKEPKTQLGPRSNYFKLWSLAVGREPKMNEPMDPAKIIGVEFAVTVVNNQRHGGGEYSLVSEVERLSDGGSLLNTQCSILNAHDSALKTQDSKLKTQALSRSDAQVCLSEHLQSDNESQDITAVASDEHNVKPACEQNVQQQFGNCDSPVPARFSSRRSEYEEAVRYGPVMYRDGRYYHHISGREVSSAEAENQIELRIQARKTRA